jgi:hypothetical protein
MLPVNDGVATTAHDKPAVDGEYRSPHRLAVGMADRQ